jgi:glycosyltransferase involved in cell wall biosynthesis
MKTKGKRKLSKPEKVKETKSAKKTKSSNVSTVKKKLLIATDSYLPRWDGVARFLSEIIPEIHDDFDITVIAPKFPGKHFISKKIKEIRLPLHNVTIGDYTPPKKDTKIMKDAVKNADFIWTQTIGPIGSSIINIGKSLNKRVITYIHSIEWELVSKSLNKPLLRDSISLVVLNYARNLYNKCSLLMVPSRATGDILLWKKIKTKKLVVPLGVNTTKFIPAINKDMSKMRLNISPQTRIIGFSGRIAYEKNLTTLIRAFIRLKEEYDNIQLMIVGDGVQELKDKFSKIKGVKLVGSTDNVVPYLQAMDIYVLPSLTETTSLSTLEAMSCGLPVVVTPVGDVMYYVLNNVNGLKFAKENSFELSVKIRKLLDQPELRERIGNTGRLTIEEKFSWKNSVKNIKQILKDFSP